MSDKEESNDILNTVLGVGNAYAACDVGSVLQKFSANRKVFVFGTQKADRREGLAEIRAQVEADFKLHPKGYAMVLSSIHTDRQGDVAWLAAECENRDLETQESSLSKLTVVLVLEDADWKIVQWHKSRPTK